ncbi:MAG: DUF362 domain-containing protein [Polyangiaceae bacterium]|nr:DUF362 domain-containing protein [Polyangiaceae bacterium]
MARQPGTYSKDTSVTRRQFAIGGAALFSTAVLGASRAGRAVSEQSGIEAWVAEPPAGFAPLKRPGQVVKVSKGSSASDLMQQNQLWPKPEVARSMLERAMTEFTGASDLVGAMRRFISPADRVAIKVNGIAGQSGFTMAVNFELIQPVVQAVLAVGVAPERLVVYEQYPNFLSGTRINIKGNKLPPGVQARFHSNRLAKMPQIRVFKHIPTKYVTFLTDATAVIDMTLIKDHSICGYTGTMKNITHGSIINPHDHHTHQASPQIALLYNHPIVTSRVRLHITDGFKIIYDQGPLDKNPRRRILHGAVYVATDPVAMDTVGWKVIDDARQAHGLKTLAEVRREPKYIDTAASLGLGIRDMNQIRLRQVQL